MQEEFEEVAGAGVCNKFLFPTPGPDSMGNQVIVYPRQPTERELLGSPLWQGEGLGGVLYSARRGLRRKEARENWEEREERKGKKTTPEGSKFLTFLPLFVSDNNELFERK